MIRTYALLLLPVAIAFLVLGIRAWIKMFSSTEIIKFPFSQNETEFCILNPGYYAIYIHAKVFRLIPTKWFPKITSVSSSKEITIINTLLFGVRTNSFDNGKWKNLV